MAAAPDSSPWPSEPPRSLLPRDELLTVLTRAKRVAHLLHGVFVLVILAQKSFYFLLVTRGDVLKGDIPNTVNVKESPAFQEMVLLVWFGLVHLWVDPGCHTH